MSEHLKQALEALHRIDLARSAIGDSDDGLVALGMANLARETYDRLSKESASAIEGRAVTDAIDYNAVVEEVAGIVRQHLRAVQGFTFHPVYVDETVREPLTETLKRFHESAFAMQPPQPTGGVSDG